MWTKNNVSSEIRERNFDFGCIFRSGSLVAIVVHWWVGCLYSVEFLSTTIIGGGRYFNTLVVKTLKRLAQILLFALQTYSMATPFYIGVGLRTNSCWSFASSVVQPASQLSHKSHVGKRPCCHFVCYLLHSQAGWHNLRIGSKFSQNLGLRTEDWGHLGRPLGPHKFCWSSPAACQLATTCASLFTGDPVATSRSRQSQAECWRREARRRDNPQRPT